jgi:hypothetical protein
MYKMLRNKEDGCIEAVLKPSSPENPEALKTRRRWEIGYD